MWGEVMEGRAGMAGEVTPGSDLAAYLRRYPVEVAFGGDDPGQVFDRYHGPGYVLVNDGVALDRERLLAHVRPARKNATEINVAVAQTHVCGGRVAARYTLTARMRRGQVIATEIFMFGELDPDGRLHRVDQLTHVLADGG